MRTTVPAFLFAAANAVALLTACGTNDDGNNTTNPDVVVIGDTTGDVGVDGTDVVASCIDNTDCRGGEVCRDSVCLVACGADRPCADAVCDESRGVCVGCLEDDDCSGPGGRCVNQVCEAGCADDGDCSDGDVCNSVGACVSPGCQRDADCPGGTRCRDFVCTSIDPAICTPDSTRCDQQTLVTCSRDGTREERTPCADALCIERDGAAACLAPLCTPDSVTCVDGETAGLCDETGTSYQRLPCREGQYCLDGTCLPRICTPNSETCAGSTIIACDALGATETITVCADLEVCASNPAGCACVDADCVPRICVPGSSRCVGNAAQACNELGTAYNAPTNCTGENVCQVGLCVSPSCTPGAATCAGDTLLTCASDGRTRTTLSCPTSGEICVTADGMSRCDDPICAPDTIRCSSDGRARLLCDARGAVESRSDCAANRYCVASACTELPCDPRSCAEIDAAGLPRVDSDGDGLADCLEGTTPGPRGTPACVDPDQDGDGILDGDEPNCVGVNAIVLADADDDGFDDALERLAGSDPCDPLQTPEDLADHVVVLDADPTPRTLRLDVPTSAPPMDVVLMLDTTGSMGLAISALRGDFSTGLATPLASDFPGLAWALTTYADFPCGDTGSSGDRPFVLVQRVTTRVSDIVTALSPLAAGGGADTPESTYEALYQIVTGAGVTGCGMTVPAFNPSQNRVVGVADGPNPGVGFRLGAQPLILHVTDAVAQAATAYGGSFAATEQQALDAVRLLDAQYVAVNTGTTTAVTTQLNRIATEVDARVSPCAWGNAGNRPANCAVGQCCTGVSGAGVTAVGGLCAPVTAMGSANSSAIVPSLRALVRGAIRGRPYALSPSLTAIAATTLRPQDVFPEVVAGSVAAGTSACSLGTSDGEVWSDVYPGMNVRAVLTIEPSAVPSNTAARFRFEAQTMGGGAMAARTVLLLRR